MVLQSMVGISLLGCIFSIFLRCTCCFKFHTPRSPSYGHVNSHFATLKSEMDNFRLPPKLRRIVDALSFVPDDRLRYEELLHLASEAKPMPKELKISENKVPGCLSIVHVSASLNDDSSIEYLGDSDSLLTKGLVTLLVNGLSGSKIEEIVGIDPQFIKHCGIARSLTAGRNTGFMNMLKVMKQKALLLASASTNVEEDNAKTSSVKSVIERKLSTLRPNFLQITDESYKHRNHAGIASDAKETHFHVHIVAECFRTLSKVDSHKLIYSLLDEELKGGVHSLSITAE